jgi:hypothetical protein
MFNTSQDKHTSHDITHYIQILTRVDLAYLGEDFGHVGHDKLWEVLQGDVHGGVRRGIDCQLGVQRKHTPSLEAQNPPRDQGLESL